MAYDEDGGEFDLNAQQERMQAARKKYDGLSLKDLIVAMRDAKIVKEDLELKLKSANAEFDVLRFEKVPEKMDEEEVDKITYEGIGRVSLTGDIRLSLPKQNTQPLFKWFRSHKLSDLITETVNSSTLKAWVKGRIKEGKPYPAELLLVTPITRASITKG